MVDFWNRNFTTDSVADDRPVDALVKPLRELLEPITAAEVRETLKEMRGSVPGLDGAKADDLINNFSTTLATANLLLFFLVAPGHAGDALIVF